MFQISTAAADATNISHSTSVHVGNPSTDFLDWVRSSVYFHRFADLPFDEEIISSPFWCLGHGFKIGLLLECEHLYDEYNNSNDTAGIRIHFQRRDCVNMEFRIAIRGKSNNELNVYRSNGQQELEGIEEEYGTIQYEAALQNLLDGALVIHVYMKPLEYRLPFLPKNPSSCYTVQALFMDRESSDIVFEIAGKQITADEEKTQTEPALFHAHHLILKKAAPILADLVTSNKPSPSFHVSDTSAEVFDIVLRYIYGHDSLMLECGISVTKEVLETADKFGVTNLKLEAEARFVFLTTITFDNVMELLHFADSKNCALLKEVVIDFVVKNKIEILEKRMLAGSPEGVGSDILAAIARQESKCGVLGCDDNVYSAMSINDLRRCAFGKGLDVDGSRDMLISALQGSSSKKRVRE